MDQFEKYVNNVDIDDKHNINHVKISKAVTYHGEYKLIKKHKKICKCHPPTLASAVIGIDNTDIPIPDRLEFYNAWTDIDAQEAYLKTKPTSYLILGKPGTGAHTLGEAISKKLHCVHLCPKNVLNDEIEQKSPTGRTLDYNMRHNKVCQIDSILSIITKKLESPAVKHRGFVVSGLPMVSSERKLQLFFNGLSGEESIQIVDEILYDLMCNLKKKKHKAKQSSSYSSITSEMDREEIEVEEEQEPEVEQEEAEERVELPKYLLDTCCNVIQNKQSYYKILRSSIINQIEEIFCYKPDIIINITCPNTDVITKRSRKYFNYMNSANSFNPFMTNNLNEVMWPPKYSIQEYTHPFDTHTFNPKYNCKHPLNITINAKEQICNFKDHVQKYIEEKIKGFDPKYVLRIDGRRSVHHMMHFILERINFLQVKPVLFPEPLYLEEPPEDYEEFWKVVEELNVVRSQNVNFNRYSSSWHNRCPVELKMRRSILGNPRFAVSFFKHVYLLSSLRNMISFCKNPRPFLQLKYLEPTCRIIVIGTKSSGKTQVSRCLAWLFDTTVINYKDFFNNEKKKKYDTYAKNILSEIIANIEDSRFIKWENTETDRISSLNIWFNTNHNLLSKYINIFKEIKRLEQDNEGAGNLKQLLLRQSNLKSKLCFLTFLDDIDICEKILQGQNLNQYAPLDLLKETEKPKLPVLGDEDVTIAISSYIKTNDLEKEIEPTPEEIMKELINFLKIRESETLTQSFDQCYSKFVIDDFPSEMEYWQYLSEADLLPDYTISLIENREIDDDLLKHYVDIEKSIKNYQERFLQAKDSLINIKLLRGTPLNSMYLDMKTIVDESIQNVLNIIFEGTNINDGHIDSEFQSSFVEGLEKFRENWESLKVKLDEQSKFYAAVELEGKSDIEVIDDVLLKVRTAYCNICAIDEDKDVQEQDNENDATQDLLNYNDDRNLSDTSIYCPVCLTNYSILWEGKPDISTKYNNRIIMFSKEECLEQFQKDPTRYQSLAKPFKTLPSLRICVVGNIGSGKSSLSSRLAKELGLIYVNFDEYINTFIIPKHFQKVGWQYENNFTDKVADEENATEFQMDEENANLITDLLFNETEIRKIISNYLEQGVAMPALLTQKIIKTLWFEEPYKTTGILVDGFPKLPNDVEDMLASYCIPNLVLKLEGNSENAVARISPRMFKIWKTQLKEAKQKMQTKLELERQAWFDLVTKKVVTKLIVDEIIDSIDTNDEFMPDLSVQSTIFDANPLGSPNVDANLFKTYNEIIQEFPEPIDQSEWEKPDDVLDRINGRIEAIYEVFEENIQSVKDVFIEQRIKVVSLNGLKSMEKVFRNSLEKMTPLRYQNESFLEQTFIINCDIAEMLINEGFFFLSKFYRMCPVYLYENPLTLFNPFNESKRRGKIFPVIHRAYIYFVSSEAFVRKFRQNPLRYIKSRKIESYVEYPLRVAIIGPPKSGKSILAAKLAKRFGLLCLSRGSSVRFVLENMKWTELCSKMFSSLQAGLTISTQHLVSCIQAVTMDHRALTNGIIFDGFPESPLEAAELFNYGLYPLIIFDIKSSLPKVLESSQREIYPDILKIKPPYSKPFIEFRYQEWEKNSGSVRKWINDDIQNLYQLYGEASSWQSLYSACSIIDDVSKKVHNYLSNYETKVVRADVMCISKEIFNSKMSNFKNFCPMCFIKNVYRSNEHPVDNSGIVQFRDIFYWVCREHINNLQKLPLIVLSLTKEIQIPEIPAVVNHIDKSLVYENGICIVTYAENLPAQKIIKGNNTFAAIYKGKYYLFCSSKCLDSFVIKPHMYFDIYVFKDACGFPELSLKSLPNLGYLEQTLGNLITEACCAVNVTRPKYLGLDIGMSGAIYIAFYLKTHNPHTDPEQLKLYLKALKVFEARCKLSIDVGLQLRSVDNPFNNYANCCKKIKSFVFPTDSGTVAKPSSTISTIDTYK